MEAVSALSVWAHPSVLDRVDGRFRGNVARDTATIGNHFGNGIIGLLKNKDAELRLQAAKAVLSIHLIDAEPMLLQMLRTDPKPEVRREALISLAGMKYPDIGTTIGLAIADREKMVRIAGIDLLGKSNVSPVLMVKLLSDVINTKSTEEKQAALLTLGKLPVALSGRVINAQLDKMAAGTLSPEVYIELSEAVDSTHDASLISKYKKISAGLSPDELTAAYAGSLYGGNPDRGRAIFFNGEASQCIRCHSYNDYGGNAGPRLNGIATRLTRQQLLEALINPSARISPGFGMVTVKTRDGAIISGTLLEETSETVKVKSGDDPVREISKSQISDRKNANSSMPEMRYLLSKREIRDVVSFLATLKE
jgi:putative heme-binding domain-containing protein